MFFHVFFCSTAVFLAENVSWKDHLWLQYFAIDFQDFDNVWHLYDELTKKIAQKIAIDCQ